MNGRRTPTDAERLEHVQTLELLGQLITQLPTVPEVQKEFVVFSPWVECSHPERETQPLEFVLREPAAPRADYELALVE